jgi:hypothetical protein
VIITGAITDFCSETHGQSLAVSLAVFFVYQFRQFPGVLAQQVPLIPIRPIHPMMRRAFVCLNQEWLILMLCERDA